MIFGEYPCCDGLLTLAVPDNTPAFSKEECPHCGTAVWHRLSRIDPQSWTEEAFLAAYTVDDKAMSVTAKGVCKNSRDGP